MHKLITVLLAGALLATPVLAKTPEIDIQALHEKCRLAIEQGTKFTTIEDWSGADGNEEILAITASFEEQYQAREGTTTEALVFLTEEGFIGEISGQDVVEPTITREHFGAFNFTIATQEDEHFIQVVRDGKPCGVWEVTKKSS
jgi:hypothetical protein